MANMVTAELARDAALIGRYFGGIGAAAAAAVLPMARTLAAPVASTTAASRPASSEGDGSGVRMSAASGAPLAMGAFGGGHGVRFMSMFGAHRSADPITAEAIAKYF